MFSCQFIHRCFTFYDYDPPATDVCRDKTRPSDNALYKGSHEIINYYT